MLKLTPLDPARHIETVEDAFFYLGAAMDGGDYEHFARALADVFRSGVIELADKTARSRTSPLPSTSGTHRKDRT